MHGARFTGLSVALATPFTPAGQVDLPAFGRLVDHVVGGGADVLVVLGSTGEAATVDDAERALLVEAAREHAAGRPVVVGVGHNDTRRSVALARAAAAAGADGLLLVTPYYSKPQPAGIEAHVREVCAAAPGLPVVLYNVPGRTGVNLDPATVLRLWAIDQVVGVKESSGDLRQIARICAEAPSGKVVLAGDDDLALPAVAVGAHGLVSVCANVVPERTARMLRAALRGELDQARREYRTLLPLMTALFSETNPVPLKAALAGLGLGSALVRTPLAPAAPQTWAAVHQALSALGVERVVTREDAPLDSPVAAPPASPADAPLDSPVDAVTS